MKRKNIFIPLGTVILFSLLYVMGIFGGLENQVFDFFLHFRAERERIDEVVFINVDDPAIAYNGVFPWPRSIMADSLIRLKEFGARAAIFDIEYIDKGPPGVDVIYLNNGLSADFERSFTEIRMAAGDIFSAIRQGRMNRNDIDMHDRGFQELINDEKESLYTRAQNVARDNDLYLIQASALFGRSWVTLNLREDVLEGEQAERRVMAEELFSYPINAIPGTEGGVNIGILPPLPGFAMTAEGAGYTNVEVDNDGIRRRIRLAQNVQEHWYLQLSFSPLMYYLGNPEIDLTNNWAHLKGVKTPEGITKDISIPLDGKARMILDWPREDYIDSYSHISFADFSLLEDREAEMEKYVRALGTADLAFFGQFDHSISGLPFIIADLADLFDDLRDLKAAALEYCSDELYAEYLDYRGQGYDLVQEIIDMEAGVKVSAMAEDLAEAFPENAEEILDEAEYINTLASFLKTNLERYKEESKKIENAVKDKFCILGRSDTGTTDIGSNPFHAKYVNVGTHGVVLDMILSETFLTPIAMHFRVLFALVFVFLFFLASSKFPPTLRAVSGFTVTALVIAGAAILFRYTGIFFSPLLTILSMITAIIVREIVSYAGSEREKQFIRKAFSTYVSDDVVKEIISDPSRLQLGGTKHHMSAIFTDVQKFSTISEQLEPESLVNLLNRYLTLMSNRILAENGTIDKFEGDAIIAFFGAPIPTTDHAVRACSSAIAMRRLEMDFNAKVMEEKLSPIPLLTRVGINTGSMVAGNMGTEKKMNYTIMGNAVNLAARLEGVNKQYGTWVIASDATIQETGGLFLTRKLDRVRVVGINEPVRLHELLETMDNASPEQKNLVEVFHHGLDLFELRKWKEAAKAFKEAHALEEGGPSAKYLERCKTYITTPPKDNWDGVYNLTEK